MTHKDKEMRTNSIMDLKKAKVMDKIITIIQVEDRFLFCKNNPTERYCDIKKEPCGNGYASQILCCGCENFKQKNDWLVINCV